MMSVLFLVYHGVVFSLIRHGAGFLFTLSQVVLVHFIMYNVVSGADLIESYRSQMTSTSEPYLGHHKVMY